MILKTLGVWLYSTNGNNILVKKFFTPSPANNLSVRWKQFSYFWTLSTVWIKVSIPLLFLNGTTRKTDFNFIVFSLFCLYHLFLTITLLILLSFLSFILLPILPIFTNHILDTWQRSHHRWLLVQWITHLMCRRVL